MPLCSLGSLRPWGDGDASECAFRTAPLFETASATYDWLNRVLAVGIGRRTPGQVSYTVYAVR